MVEHLPHTRGPGSHPWHHQSMWDDDRLTLTLLPDADFCLVSQDGVEEQEDSNWHQRGLGLNPATCWLGDLIFIQQIVSECQLRGPQACMKPALCKRRKKTKQPGKSLKGGMGALVAERNRGGDGGEDH